MKPEDKQEENVTLLFDVEPAALSNIFSNGNQLLGGAPVLPLSLSGNMPSERSPVGVNVFETANVSAAGAVKPMSDNFCHENGTTVQQNCKPGTTVQHLEPSQLAFESLNLVKGPPIDPKTVSTANFATNFPIDRPASPPAETPNPAQSLQPSEDEHAEEAQEPAYDIGEDGLQEEEGSNPPNAPEQEEIDDDMDAVNDIPPPIADGAAASQIPQRVDISLLPVVENPLQKEGRHTVIRGRLPDDDPFVIGANLLGRKLVSKKYEGVYDVHDEEMRKNYFIKDLYAFNREIHTRHIKLPIIGGGNLDLYSLTKEVILLGGVENVVKKRAFRIVAQQLKLPKSCTSAAYVLKGAYERLLYYYETRLVYGTWPENPSLKVDMKSIVSQKKKEKLASRMAATGIRTKRRRSTDREEDGEASAGRKRGLSEGEADEAEKAELHEQGGYAKRRKTSLDPRAIKMLSSMSSHPSVTHQYLRRVANDDGDHYTLPRWAHEIPEHDPYLAIIETIQRIDQNQRVGSAAEVIVLAMAECFQDQRLAACTGSGSNKRDLGLAKAVCLLPPKAQYTRKAQGFLFCLLINVTRNPSTALLASNNSASGLLDGLFGLIQVFYVKCLKAGSQKDGSEQAPFLDSNNKVVNRDAAAAYCSLRILESLSKEPQNRSRIVQHKGFPMLIGPLFTHAKLPECFLLSIMSMVQECYPLLLSTTGEVVLEVLGDGLLSRLEESANIGGGCSNEGTEEREAEKGDMEVCSKALTILGSYSQNIGLESKCLSRLIITICKLLHCQHAIANTRGLAVVVYNLTARFPGVVSESVDFIQGVFKLLRDTRCTEKVLEALRLIQREKPLQEYAKDVGLMGQWVKRCEENKAIEEAHEAAISQAQNGKIGEAVRGADITDLFHVNDFDLGAESMNGPGGGIDFEGLLFPSEDFDILDAGGIPKNDPLLGDY